MSVELLQNLGSVKFGQSGSYAGTTTYNGDHLLFTGYIWPTPIESYIPIIDCTHTFRYDYIYENIAGNYFYIGIERYDKDKATGSNSCCIYQVATNNTAHTSPTRITGTVNLNQTISSTNTNKTAFIRLRILNQWSGSSATNATAKIYRLSLREMIGDNKIKIYKTGILTSDTFWENSDRARVNDYDVVESKEFFEL